MKAISEKQAQLLANLLNMYVATDTNDNGNVVLVSHKKIIKSEFDLSAGVCLPYTRIEGIKIKSKKDWYKQIWTPLNRRLVK